MRNYQAPLCFKTVAVMHPQSRAENGCDDCPVEEWCALKAENEQLRGALKDVLVYAPDYMHGEPKKHYEKIALGKKQ